METEYDDIEGISQLNEGRANQSIIIDTGKHAAAIAICAAICGFCFLGAIVAGVIAWQTSTEYRVLLNHTMKLEAQLEAHLEGNHATADRR